MIRDTIKKRLAALAEKITPGDKVVTVEMPDGTRTKKSAIEWWEHRKEWRLSDFEHQDNGGGLVACLVFAALFDDGIIEARAAGDAPEVERLTDERNEMLKMYFGDEYYE